MYMNAPFNKCLNQNLSPLFFVAVCAAILLVALGVRVAIGQIGDESDNGTALFSATHIVR